MRAAANSRGFYEIGRVGPVPDGTIGAVKVLITGSSGYLGRQAVQAALEIALRDHVFDNGLAKKLLKWRPRKSDIESAIDA